MKYFMLMSSILLLSFPTEAQIQRPENVPSFYVPQKDLPKHISANKRNAVSEKTKEVKIPEDQSVGTEPPTANFQKKYDIYHSNIVTLKETGKLPRDAELDEILTKANSNDHFLVTQEK